jgi:hypothetical protein
MERRDYLSPAVTCFVLGPGSQEIYRSCLSYFQAIEHSCYAERLNAWANVTRAMSNTELTGEISRDINTVGA